MGNTPDRPLGVGSAEDLRRAPGPSCYAATPPEPSPSAHRGEDATPGAGPGAPSSKALGAAATRASSRHSGSDGGRAAALCPLPDQQPDTPPVGVPPGTRERQLGDEAGVDPRYLVRGEVPSWVRLPGDREDPHGYRVWLCPRHGPVNVPTRDRRAGCAPCHPSWRERAAARAVDVFQRARRAGVRGRLWPATVRPPWGAVPPTEDALDAFLRDVQLVLRAHGLAGGALMAHAVGKRAPGRWGPHAHAVGPLEGRRWTPGPVVDPDGEGPRPREVLARLEGLSPSRRREVLAALRRWRGSYLHFGDEKGRPVRGRGLWKNLAVVLRYELGHAVRREGRDALRWFGALASNAARQGWPPSRDAGDPRPPRCPTCGRAMDPAEDLDLTDALHPEWVRRPWDPGGWAPG